MPFYRKGVAMYEIKSLKRLRKEVRATGAKYRTVRVVKYDKKKGIVDIIEFEYTDTRGRRYKRYPYGHDFDSILRTVFAGELTAVVGIARLTHKELIESITLPTKGEIDIDKLDNFITGRG